MKVVVLNMMIVKCNLTGLRYGKLLVQEFEFKKGWKCICDCGNIRYLDSTSLKKGIDRSCGCERRRFLLGQKFGDLLVIENRGLNVGGAQLWLCKCDCGTSIEFCTTDLLTRNKTHCGCKYDFSGEKHGTWKGHGEISGSYWNHVINGARKRNLSVTVSIEFVWELFLKQNKRCALSGLDIVIKRLKNSTIQTASLDRINSNLGYIEGNIQWIHKDLNKMKMDFPNEYFIQICKLVSNTNPSCEG